MANDIPTNLDDAVQRLIGNEPLTRIERAFFVGFILAMKTYEGNDADEIDELADRVRTDSQTQ